MPLRDLRWLSRAPHSARPQETVAEDRSSVAIVLLALAACVPVALGFGAWHVLVPEMLTIAEFSGASALALALMFTAAVVSLRARATRSIAHVLYDTEHPPVKHS